MTTTSHNRTTRRSLLGGAGIVAAAGLLSACNPNGSTGTSSGNGTSGPAVGASYDDAIRDVVGGREIKVGFTPPVLSENFTQIEHAAFRRMSELEERYGCTWVWERQSPVGDFSAVQGTLGIVQSWMARGFDAIAVSTGANFATVQDLYRQAKDDGVKVYQFNQPAELYPEEDLLTVTNVGYDNRWQSGYLAGKYIAEKLGGSGRILQIWGPSGSDWTRARRIGFDKALTEFPGLEVVGEADGGYVRDKGLQAAQDLLTRDSDIDAIYGENEEMALGASQAIDAAGLKHWDGTDGIITIGADGLMSGYQQIRAKKLTATVDIGGVDQGQNLVEAIFQTIALGQTVTQFINNPTQVVDLGNVGWHEAYTQWALDAPTTYGS